MLTFTSRLPHAVAATLHLLLVGVLVAISATARAQVVVLPSCNFQEVDLVPCMAASAAGSAGGALLENGLLVPVTGRISAGPCGRH